MRLIDLVVPLLSSIGSLDCDYQDHCNVLKFVVLRPLHLVLGRYWSSCFVCISSFIILLASTVEVRDSGVEVDPLSITLPSDSEEETISTGLLDTRSEEQMVSSDERNGIEVVPLKEDNYHRWTIELRTALEALDRGRRHPSPRTVLLIQMLKVVKHGSSEMRRHVWSFVGHWTMSSWIKLKIVPPPNRYSLDFEVWKNRRHLTLLTAGNEFMGYQWMKDMTITSFYAGLQLIYGKVDSNSLRCESHQSCSTCGRKFEKILMAKVLACLPEPFSTLSPLGTWLVQTSPPWQIWRHNFLHQKCL